MEWNIINSVFPPNVSKILRAVLPPSHHNGCDTRVWPGHKLSSLCSQFLLLTQCFVTLIIFLDMIVGIGCGALKLRMELNIGCGALKLRMELNFFNLGPSNAYVAELWYVLDGLRLERERGFTHVQVQVDYLEVVAKSLMGHFEGSIYGFNIIAAIGKLLQENWHVEISHVYREANSCAGILANLGCKFDLDFVIFEHPPHQVSQALLFDVYGSFSAWLRVNLCNISSSTVSGALN
ncbi:hypothetical protein RIF29_18989 [Crotalaria pallida]|uniref:RNase H type-1 domain-containing protein n=1 Tax=Crotalaria pallida TaxID=3830 RepID=A0AAN9F0Z0_CROPI